MSLAAGKLGALLGRTFILMYLAVSLVTLPCIVLWVWCGKGKVVLDGRANEEAVHQNEGLEVDMLHSKLY